MALNARLDNIREVYTPEGVALHLPTAGPVPRAVAWGIDTLVRIVLFFIFALVVASMGDFGAGLMMLMAFCLLWVYPVLCEVLFNGQTLGKRVMSLRVVSADGAPVGWLASCARTLLRAVDFLPLGYGFGITASLLDPQSRRLGDMVARTVVIYAPREPARKPQTAQGMMAPLAPLQAHEQGAVIAFSERARLLTRERQEELADIAAPAVGNGGALGVARLHAVANWLLGRNG